jgi:hypothetical protein
MRSTAVACVSLTRSFDTASRTLANGYPLTELEEQWAEGNNESGRLMSDEEMVAYRKPLNPGEDRRPTLCWPRQIPIDGEPPMWPWWSRITPTG